MPKRRSQPAEPTPDPRLVRSLAYKASRSTPRWRSLQSFNFKSFSVMHMSRLLYQGPGHPTRSERDEVYRAFGWFKTNRLIDADNDDPEIGGFYRLNGLGHAVVKELVDKDLRTRVRRDMPEARRKEISVYRKLSPSERVTFKRMDRAEKDQFVRDHWKIPKPRPAGTHE